MSSPAEAGAMPLAEADVAALQAALARNRCEIRRCQQQARRQEAFLGRGGLSCLGVRKVLAVYVLSKWDLRLACVAAKRLSRLPKASEAFPTADFVENLFRQHDMEELLTFYEDHGSWQKARNFAQEFLLEHDAWSWVKEQNLSRGVAPSAAAVFHYFESKKFSSGPCYGQPRRRSVHKWAARWRKRWGVRRTCLRPADPLNPDILREKVENLANSRVLILNHF